MKWSKLRDIESVAPSIMDELRVERDKGASYVQLAVLVYDKTRIVVDPTTVRAWFLAEQQDQEPQEPIAEQVIEQHAPSASAEVPLQSTSTGRVRVRYRG